MCPCRLARQVKISARLGLSITARSVRNPMACPELPSRAGWTVVPEMRMAQGWHTSKDVLPAAYPACA